MRFYFLSEKPCALKIGGLFFGMVGNAEKFLDVDPADLLLCEFIPADGNFQSVSFIIDGEYPSHPCVSTYVFPSYALFFVHDLMHADSSMRLITQKVYPDCAVSVFLQGRVQVSVEAKEELKVHFLSDRFLSCNVDRRENCIILIGNGEIAVLNSVGELLLDAQANDVTLDDKLRFSIPFYDYPGNYADCIYSFKDKFLMEKYVISSARKPKKDFCLLALAENLQIGAEVKDFVTPTLYERKADLKKFLGNYEKVFFIKPDIIGLAYKRVNYYDVTLYTAEYKDGLVDNVREFIRE